MTPGVTIGIPTNVHRREWVAQPAATEIASTRTARIARVAEAGPDDMARAVAARGAFDHGPWRPPARRARQLMAMTITSKAPGLSAAWTAQVGGLASFAPIMHGGGVAGGARIRRWGNSFPWSNRRRAWWSTPR